MGTSFAYPYLRDLLPSSIFQSLWLKFLIPTDENLPNPVLQTKALCTTLSSPIGISSGLDINGEAYSKLLKLGVGFIELGPVLPSAEGYSYSPYFISEDSLKVTGPVTSCGATAIKKRLRLDESGPRGIDLSTSKENTEIIPNMTDDDYQYLLIKLYHLSDFFTVNLCENEFRRIEYYQKPYRYEALIKKLVDQRNFEIGLYIAFQTGLIDYFEHVPRKLYIPLYIKINTNWQDIPSLIEVCVTYGIDGIIVGDENDDILQSRKILEITVQASKNRLEVISYGGIKTGLEVLERITKGAKAVQIFSVFLCKGPHEIFRIHQELVESLKKEGFPNIEAAYNYYNRNNIR